MTTPNWKPEPWKRVKARRKAQEARARSACCDTVWTRAHSRCECDGCRRCNPDGDHRRGLLDKPKTDRRLMFRFSTGWRCGAYVKRASTYFREVGHVDEKIPRSQGGDPTDPENCRLLCHDCHFSGPSGAHRITKR